MLTYDIKGRKGNIEYYVSLINRANLSVFWNSSPRIRKMEKKKSAFKCKKLDLLNRLNCSKFQIINRLEFKCCKLFISNTCKNNYIKRKK